MVHDNDKVNGDHGGEENDDDDDDNQPQNNSNTFYVGTVKTACLSIKIKGIISLTLYESSCCLSGPVVPGLDAELLNNFILRPELLVTGLDLRSQEELDFYRAGWGSHWI